MDTPRQLHVNQGLAEDLGAGQKQADALSPKHQGTALASASVDDAPLSDQKS